MMKKWGKALREKEMQIAIEQRKNPETVEASGFWCARGDLNPHVLANTST